MNRHTSRKHWKLLPAAVSVTFLALGQVSTEVPPPVPGAKPVVAERIKVHGAALEGNLEGNSVDREVIVFLPPSYAAENSRRYPVVYALHGYSIGAEQWTKEIHAPQTIEGAFALGAQEMVVVLPDSKTVHNGSMYSSSATTGDFEGFVVRDVVAYIDSHYHTIAKRTSRALVGHSMGGYGASRIGMKHPEVFGSLYIMSPCCMTARTAGPVNPASEKSLEGVKSAEDSAKLDVGDQDGLKAGASKLHEVLDSYRIPNGFEIYKGTHTSAVSDRFQNHVLPFFSKNLCAGKACS